MNYNNQSKNPLICIFDSGIGGLNFLKACAQKLPNYDFCYFADNYNMPYGNLSQDKIFVLVNQKFKIMQALGCRAAVIACNTATAVCIQKLRALYPFPIIGIQPAIKQAAKSGSSFTVLATPITANSASFKSLMEEYATPKSSVVALPDLARQIEQNIFNLNALNLSKVLPTLNTKALVLGCTHYIFLKSRLQKSFNCAVYDGIAGTVDHLCAILGNSDHFLNNNQKITFLLGDINKNKAVYAKLTKKRTLN